MRELKRTADVAARAKSLMCVESLILRHRGRVLSVSPYPWPENHDVRLSQSLRLGLVAVLESLGTYRGVVDVWGPIPWALSLAIALI